MLEGVSSRKNLEHQIIDDAAPPMDSRRLRRNPALIFVFPNGVIMTIILGSASLPARNHRLRTAAES